jgi:hypothetical protein
LVVLFTLIMFFMAPRTGSANTEAGDLATRVAALELGMNGYVIGEKLSPVQKGIAAANSIKDSYDGTYKFLDNGAYVIASKADDMILALYQRNEEAGMQQAKDMVSGLMGLYGEPTTMAHEKLIYWAYGADGKIPEETFAMLKETSGTAGILATVKFSSSFAITAENSDQEGTGVIYFIVSSDPLLLEFINRDK